jgi:uncharacterized repeat protein (TIGR03803 family)
MAARCIRRAGPACALAAWLAGTAAAAPRAASPGGNHPDLWNFTAGTDGASPRGDLIVDAAGNLYGTTSVGGSHGAGSVFMATPSATGSGLGSETTIYDFTGGADGSLPTGGLVADSSGALYGTTSLDGAGLAGTVFRLMPPATAGMPWLETTLWSFGSGTDGRNPVGTLVFDSSGALYGTAMYGGSKGYGVVFKLTPQAGGSGAWQEQVLWNFTGKADGANPVAAVTVNAAGAVFGTAKAGGKSGAGTVFELSSAGGKWSETTLWNFTGGADGSSPSGTLLSDGNGGFYGSAEFGGPVNPNCNQARYPYYGQPNSESAPAAGAAYVPPGGNGCGLIFDLVPPAAGKTAWTETIVYQFTGGPDGANPAAGLVQAQSGALYGLNTQYGETFWGTLFELIPPSPDSGPWALIPVAAFNGKDEGFYPRGTPLFGFAGRLYGTTSVGGKYWTHVSNYGYGTVFSSTP